MKTAGFWKKDWFLGLAVAIVLAAFAGSDLIQSLERKAYDLGVRATDAHALRPHRGRRDRRREHPEHRPLAVAARRAREDDRHAHRRQGEGDGEPRVLHRAAARPRLAVRQQARGRVPEGGPRSERGRAGLAGSRRSASSSPRRRARSTPTASSPTPTRRPEQRAAADAVRARRPARQAGPAAARLRHPERARRDRDRIVRAAVPDLGERDLPDRAPRQAHRGRSATSTRASMSTAGPHRAARARATSTSSTRRSSMMIAAKSLNLGVGDIKVSLARAWPLGNLRIAHRSATADVHVLLQGPRRAARVPGRFVLRRVHRQDPGRASTATRSC